MKKNRNNKVSLSIRFKRRVHRHLHNVYERTFLATSSLAGFLLLAPKFSTKIDAAYLFILALPRSGSTLLAHIIATNPEVLGYGEHHREYNSEKDLRMMASQNALRLRDFSNHPKYMMDKIVWPHLQIADSIKQSQGTRLILLARNPASTLSSMGKILQRWHDPEICYRDYIKGLERLLKDAKATGDRRRCFFMRFEKFIEDPDLHLEALGQFLEVKQPFTREYNLLPTTGKLRYGDNSESIWIGKITPLKHVDHCDFPEPLLREAEATYASFLAEMEGLAVSASDFRYPPSDLEK